MFTWIQQLLGVESVESAEEARGKLRLRMQRETESMLSYELKLGQRGASGSSRSRIVAARSSRWQSMDGSGQA